ncbi:odd Oz/ten-m homolog 4 [hydrothermal vent metagenome]|uniref:Odd Oz/ten-m homolog 4 n=1 Tax=hydrothermal vent metagenome TaxID=652676 RepID=A0A1W1BH46_9ZZZZ
MFIYKKKLFLGLLAILGIFSFAMAVVPESVGLYVGMIKADDSNRSVRILTKNDSDNISVYDYANFRIFDAIKINVSDNNIMDLICDKIYQTYNDNETYKSNSRILNIKDIFDIKCSKLPKIKKTGQTISYKAFDDGYYEKGVTPRYSRRGDIVIDHITKLQWQDDIEAKTITKNWEDAKTYCSNLTLDGYSNWRLPTIVELQSIMVDAKVPAIDTTVFLNYDSSTSKYWSSTRHVTNADYAWGVNFYNSNIMYYNNLHIRNVRCIKEK